MIVIRDNLVDYFIVIKPSNDKNYVSELLINSKDKEIGKIRINQRQRDRIVQDLFIKLDAMEDTSDGK